MTTQQTIIQQDNARLMALVAAFDSARETWAQAAETWDADPTIEAHAVSRIYAAHGIGTPEPQAIGQVSRDDISSLQPTTTATTDYK